MLRNLFTFIFCQQRSRFFYSRYIIDAAHRKMHWNIYLHFMFTIYLFIYSYK